MLKRNLKKAFSLLLAASMVFAMVGCGTGGAGDGEQEMNGGSAYRGEQRGRR